MKSVGEEVASYIELQTDIGPDHKSVTNWRELKTAKGAVGSSASKAR